MPFNGTSRVYNYRPPTKLREGYVFSPVCLYVCLGGTCTGPRSQAPPTPDMFDVVQYETRTVGKRAVGIRLNAFLLQPQPLNSPMPLLSHLGLLFQLTPNI